MSEALARVLVVDDEADLRSLLQRYLGDQGYAVRNWKTPKRWMRCWRVSVLTCWSST